MSIKDFRSNRLRISKIIGSGSATGGSPHTAIYSASEASNFTGGVSDSGMLTNVGRDVGLFVSGAVSSRTKWNAGTPASGRQGGVALFGGDLHVSGNITTSGTPLAGVTTGSFNVPNPSEFVTTASLSIAGNRGFTYTADSVGTDTYFFVSGSRTPSGSSDRTTAQQPAVSVFGGDLVVSGTLYAERQVIEVDQRSTGSLMISGSLFVSRSADISQGLIVNVENSRESSPDNRKFIVKGGNPHGDLFTASPKDGLVKIDGGNTDESNVLEVYTRDAAGTDVDLSTTISPGGALFNSSATNKFDFRVRSDTKQGAVIIDAGTNQVILGSEGTAASNAAGNSIAVGEDVSVYVSGSRGGKGIGGVSDGAAASTIVSAGDHVVSGNLYLESEAKLENGNKIYFGDSIGSDGPHISGNGTTLTVDADNILSVEYDNVARFLYGATEQIEVGSSGFIWNDNNQTSNAFDFRVQGGTLDGAVIVDAGTQQVILGSDGTDASNAGGNSTAIGEDVSVYLSGSLAGKGGSTPSTIVAAGDMVVSGTLHLSGNISVGGGGAGDQIVQIYAERGLNVQLDYPDSDTSAWFGVQDINSAYQHIFYEDGKAYINYSRNALGDFHVRGDNDYALIFTDAGEDAVAFGAALDGVPNWSDFNSEDVGPDVKIILSGTVGGKGGSTRNTTLNAGDLVVSGTVYSNTLQALAGNLSIEAKDTNADIIFVVDDSGVDRTVLTLQGDQNGGAFFTPFDGGKLSIDDAGTDGYHEFFGNGQFNQFKYSNTSTNDPVHAFNRSRGDTNSPAAVQINDDLGNLTWSGYDGSAFRNAAGILGEVDGAVGSSDVPGRIAFQTRNAGAVAATVKMTIKNDGKIGVLTENPYEQLDVRGNQLVTGFLSASMGLSGSLTRLVDGTSYLRAGSGINIVSESNGSVTITGTAVSAEWNDTGDILHPNEGVGDDVGIGNTGTDRSEYPVLISRDSPGNNRFNIELNGFVSASLGLSGSLTRLVDGTSYLRAGPGINILSQSNGSVTIESNTTGTVTSGSFNVPAGGKFATTASISVAGGLGFAHASDVGRADTYFFVSGAFDNGGSGGKNKNGVSVFGGDTVISGALYVGAQEEVKFTQAANVFNDNGVNTDFRVESQNNDHMFHVAASTNRIGIGSIAGTGPDTTLHLKESAPTFRIQRDDNANDSTIEFAGAAGVRANMVHLGGVSSNDLVISAWNENTSAVEQILNFTDQRKVIFLSSSGVHPDSMQPNLSTDLSFFVSGTIGAKDGILGGTSVFGGDVVISGSVYGGPNGLELGGNNHDVFLATGADLVVPGYIKHRNDTNTWIQFNNDRIRLNTNGATNVDMTSTQVLVVPGADSTSAEATDDVAFYVSGSATTTTSVPDRDRIGAALFGGDVAVSGSMLISGSLYNIKNPHTKLRFDQMGPGSMRIEGANAGGTDAVQILTYEPHGTPPSIGINNDGANLGVLIKANSKMSFVAIPFSATEQGVLINSDNAGEAGTDTALFVSGAVGALGLPDGHVAKRGIATFGGDVVISGSLLAGRQVHKARIEWSSTIGSDVPRFPAINGIGTTTTTPNVKNFFSVIGSGSLRSLDLWVNETSTAKASVSLFVNNSEIPSCHVTGSFVNTAQLGGAIGNKGHLFIDFNKHANFVTGSNSFNPGDAISIGLSKFAGSNFTGVYGTLYYAEDGIDTGISDKIAGSPGDF